MSAVVIRCPNCGTTQDALGTCDSCHEAEARWFCPNHDPGRWLDGPACADCGARVGVPGRAPDPRRPRRDPAGGASPAEPRASRRPPPSREATWDAPREPMEGPVRGPGAGRGIDPAEPELPWPFSVERPGMERGPLGSPRPEGLPPGVDPTWVPIDPSVIVRGAARGAMGCVGRLVMMVIVLLVLAFLVLGGFFSGAFGAEPGARPVPEAPARAATSWVRHPTDGAGGGVGGIV